MSLAILLHLICSKSFGHCYIHHQNLATILLNYLIGRIVCKDGGFSISLNYGI